MKLLKWQAEFKERLSKQRGIILDAPTGVGKGMIATHIASEYLPATVFIVVPPHLIGDWVAKLKDEGVDDVNIVTVKDKVTKSGKVNIVSYNKAGVYGSQMKVAKHSLFILDESHYLKNPKSKRFKALSKMADKADKTIVMSATPVTKSTVDLFTQAYMVNPELREQYKSFWDFSPIHCIMNTVWTGTKSISVPIGIRDESFERFIKPYYMKVTYESAGLKVPEMSHKRIIIEPPKPFLKFYNSFTDKEAFVKQLKKKSISDMTAQEYMSFKDRLSSPHSKFFQLSNGFVYEDSEATRVQGIKTKLKEVWNIRDELYKQGKQKGLLLYFFKAERDLFWKARKNTSHKIYLHNPKKPLLPQIAEFENGGYKLFVANYKSIGEGIRFKKTDYIIEFTTIYDYASLLQSRGRLRFVNRETPYTIYSFILDVPHVYSILKNIEDKEKIIQGINYE